MVFLVLSDNLLLMYLGWEGVGLCSYLLIGFYYSDPKNGAAAMKAFVVTRVGDVFLAFALFILYNELGTLNFREMVELAPAHFADGNNMLMWATLMLLGGAVGKSAQLPLQTWLADAMARCAGADRHQTRAGLFHHEPDWLHVPGAWRTGVGCGDFPSDDPCVLQSAAVPGVRFRHSGLPSRTEHL